MRVTYLAMIRPCKVETRIGQKGLEGTKKIVSNFDIIIS
jgi:hypothetical protein